MQFDDVIDRSSTYSFKWEKYKGKDILPMWVADTEFASPQAIQLALADRVKHGLFGYTLPAQYEPANQAVQRWLKDKYDWQIDPQWIVWTPGVVPAFNVACKAYCEAGDSVMIQTPNYPPLRAAPGISGLKTIEIASVEVDGRWTLDFDQLEKQASDPKCKLFIICNPMNPVGSVLNESELRRISEICNKFDVKLCSDEIHCDLILDQTLAHLPAGNFPGLENHSITLMAASKTFNVAGLGTSFAIIPDNKLRSKFVLGMRGFIPWANVMGLVATEAAFTKCDEWHADLLDYLRGNLAYIEQKIAQIDGLRMLKVEATFLAWIDASGLGLDNPQAYFESKGVGPSPGVDFGNKQFVRINFGCPRSMLEEAFKRLTA
ncbi:MalY/PatB family protein [Aliiglaciecola lipolytica]|uniref:cysteine-S-conjugate beta-lyase n=1 Tax=Aliiglaciecola lipolytica E3 TaxID=1127673 RepID=K6X737_9ALTE|nr:PatB family C-S lyase [Aliiglaciecola lipolytica]GAC16414.1 cystathionine beta-lyase patB [Aliiglaciecola lipolytica E3]